MSAITTLEGIYMTEWENYNGVYRHYSTRMLIDTLTNDPSLFSGLDVLIIKELMNRHNRDEIFDYTLEFLYKISNAPNYVKKLITLKEIKE